MVAIGYLLDNMRGVAADGETALLYANESSSEANSTFASFSPTGFQLRTSSNYMNTYGQNYIYMAIRRPHKPPTAGTDVFNATTYTGNQTSRIVGGNSECVTDLAFVIDRDAASTAYSTWALCSY